VHQSYGQRALREVHTKRAFLRQVVTSDGRVVVIVGCVEAEFAQLKVGNWSAISNDFLLAC